MKPELVHGIQEAEQAAAVHAGRSHLRELSEKSAECRVVAQSCSELGCFVKRCCWIVVSNGGKQMV